MAGGELALVPDCLRPELPADHNRHQQRAERHQDALGDAVEEVQPVGRPCLRIRDAEDIRRGDPLRAEGIETDERTQRRAAERRDEGIRFALIALAGLARLVDEMRHDDLQQGDRRRDGREYDQQVKQQAEQRAHRHLLKDVLHGDEQQLRAAELARRVERKAPGDDAQTRHQRDQRIHDDDDERIFLEVLLAVEIGAVGDHRAHAE